MADTIRMRVLRPAATSQGYHQMGDVIEVDAVHAALFEVIEFAVRLETVHVTAVTDVRHGAVEPLAGARRSRR